MNGIKMRLKLHSEKLHLLLYTIIFYSVLTVNCNAVSTVTLEHLSNCKVSTKNNGEMLYSKVVSGSGSSEDEQYDGRPTGYPQLHWLSKYQTEDEAEALQRGINLSKVI